MKTKLFIVFAVTALALFMAPNIYAAPAHVEGDASEYVTHDYGNWKTGGYADAGSYGHYESWGNTIAEGAANAYGTVLGNRSQGSDEAWSWSFSIGRSDAETTEGYKGKTDVEGFAVQGNWAEVGNIGNNNGAIGGNETWAEYHGKDNCNGLHSVDGMAIAGGGTRVTYEKSGDTAESSAGTIGGSFTYQSGNGNTHVAGEGGIFNITSMNKGSSFAGAASGAEFTYSGQNFGFGRASGNTSSTVTNITNGVHAESHADSFARSMSW